MPVLKELKQELDIVACSTKYQPSYPPKGSQRP